MAEDFCPVVEHINQVSRFRIGNNKEYVYHLRRSAFAGACSQNLFD
jgi:hypothetical protein